MASTGLGRGRPGATISVLHSTDPEELTAPGPLSTVEQARLRSARRLGTTGTLLMAAGALGAGANPVRQNPLLGEPIIGLPSRMPSSALAVVLAGMGLLVLAWLLVGQFVRRDAARRLSPRQLYTTLVLWALPLSVAPPMFSKDVYSYLAQSEIAARGLDPYQLGPAQALGVGNVLTSTVPTIWRDTPAPYGPLFLWLGRGIAQISGDNLILGIFLHRLVEIAGVGLLVWALPRLARRCGVSSTWALWLGVLNPLVLFHLVSGVHNEALMLGLMVAGVELALAGVTAAGSLTGRPLVLLLAGSALIAGSAAVKVPSLIALGFVGMALARRWGGGFSAVLRSAAVLVGVTAVVFVALSEGSGLGFGWTGTLSTADSVRSWLSLSTLAGLIAGKVGVALGLGNHTTAVLTLTRGLGALAATALGLRMLAAVHAGRIHPFGGLGITLAGVVVLFPVVHPWYLLWAAIPLAAWASAPAYRFAAVAVSAVVSLVVLPNGGNVAPFVVLQAWVAAVLALIVVVFVFRRALGVQEALVDLRRHPVRSRTDRRAAVQPPAYPEHS